MNRNNVKSSSIESIGFDPEAKVLEIEFKTGRVYRYREVPFEEYLKIMNAPSHGKYLNKNIEGWFHFDEI